MKFVCGMIVFRAAWCAQRSLLLPSAP